MVALFHLVLVVAFLLSMWLSGTDRPTIQTVLEGLASLSPFEKTWLVLSFFGLSGSVLLAAYFWIWRKIYQTFIAPYLQKSIFDP